MHDRWPHYRDNGGATGRRVFRKSSTRSNGSRPGADELQDQRLSRSRRRAPQRSPKVQLGIISSDSDGARMEGGKYNVASAPMWRDLGRTSRTSGPARARIAWNDLSADCILHDRRWMTRTIVRARGYTYLQLLSPFRTERALLPVAVVLYVHSVRSRSTLSVSASVSPEGAQSDPCFLDEAR